MKEDYIIEEDWFEGTEKIIITKGDEEKFNEIRKCYIDKIQDCFDFNAFGRIYYYALEMERLEKYFQFIKNHLQDEKLIFRKCEDEDGCSYVLENIIYVSKKYNSFIKKMEKLRKRELKKNFR